MSETLPIAAMPQHLARRVHLCWLILALFSWFASTALAADGPKLFQQYCFDCHGGGAHSGDIDLEKMLAVDNAGKQPREWTKAWKIVRQGFMPPLGADAPSPTDRKAITDWIAKEQLAVNAEKPDPGRVTIRRLNRVEYENTVQDLFGVDFGSEQSYSPDETGVPTKLRDRLPPDDTAFGFDNIGDFQTVSPSLLEKYFDIADFVVSHVIQEKPREPQMTLSSKVKAEKSADSPFTTHTVTFDVKQPGDYRIDVQFSLGGFIAYAGGYDFNMLVGDKSLAKGFVESAGNQRYRFTKVVSLPAGTNTLIYTTDCQTPDARGEKKPLEIKARVTVTGPLGPQFEEYSESHRRIFFRGPAPADKAAREAYAREILERVASRAFRRPVERETLDGLTAIAMRDDTFERGIAQSLTAILTSPKFFFRVEMQPRPDDPKEIHPLDEYALASRLSYLLWLSIPDEELTQQARDGRLRANLHAQVKRMLADPKSDRFFEDFPGQWLRTRNVLLTAITRNDQINPLRPAMKRETEMLFEDIARNDHDLLELVTANYTFLNKQLADFYGIEGVKGTEFQKVVLPPESKRGGILTQGSFLMSTSNPSRTSPVKRGLFVLENLLAVQPPPPPPGIPALDDAKVGGVIPRTVREQLAVHRQDPSCATCHAHFDPIGVALENYDLVGRWRIQENNEPIEPKETTVSGETLTGIDDLKSYFVAKKDKFYGAVTEKLLTYALGRGLEPYDAVTVDRVAAAVASDGGHFSTLLFGIIDSPPFQTRRGDTGDAKDAPLEAIPPTPPPEKRRPPQRRNFNNNNNNNNNNNVDQNNVDQLVPPPAAAPAAAPPALPPSSPQNAVQRN